MVAAIIVAAPKAPTVGLCHRNGTGRERTDNPIATKMKLRAVVGDIRPGLVVPTDAATSWNSRWSIPKFQPKKYSLSVSPATVTTKSDKAQPRKYLHRGFGKLDTRTRFNPHSNNPAAVFAFMVTEPGKTPFNPATSNTQPSNTASPNAATNVPSSRATRRELKA